MKKFLALVTAIVICMSTMTAHAKAASEYVQLYSASGTEISVYYAYVDQYRQLGWYTAEEWYWLDSLQPAFQNIVNSYDYMSLYFSADTWIKDSDFPYSPVYTDTLYKYRTDAMNSWRYASGCPVGVTSSDDQLIVVNNDGSVRISWNYTNISFKPIIAIKREYDICNVFGDVLEKVTMSTGTSSQLYIAPGETSYGWYCTYDKYENLGSARFIRNHRVTEVVFEDGTKWTNPSSLASNGEKRTVNYAERVFAGTSYPFYRTMWKF